MSVVPVAGGCPCLPDLFCLAPEWGGQVTQPCFAQVGQVCQGKTWRVSKGAFGFLGSATSALNTINIVINLNDWSSTLLVKNVVLQHPELKACSNMKSYGLPKTILLNWDYLFQLADWSKFNMHNIYYIFDLNQALDVTAYCWRISAWS